MLLLVLQGVAAGSERKGGVLMISESAPPEKRGFDIAVCKTLVTTREPIDIEKISSPAHTIRAPHA